MRRSPALNYREFASLTLILVITVQSLTVQSSALQLGTSRAQAQSQAQRSNSRVIALLLASTREEDPARAIELLKEAREEVKKEGLAPDDAARIIALIDSLEKKALRRLKPTNETTTSKQLLNEVKIAPSATLNELIRSTTEPMNSNRAIEEALASNPEVQDAMWEIGRGRLARDTQNLSAIIKDKTGKSVEELDQTAEDEIADANKPSAFLQMLNGFDILKFDFSKANLKLKQEYNGVSLDILADQLTRDAAKFSFPVGVLKGTIGQIGPAFRIVGVPTEVVANFLINAKLVLRLADLYGIELADSEKQIVLFSVYSALKAGAQYGANSATSGRLMESFGQKFGQLKFSGKVDALVSWLQKFSSNPTIAKIAGPAVAGALVTPADTAAAKTDETKTNGSTPKKRLASIRAIGSRINLMGLLSSAGQGVISASETLAMGHLAKIFFRSARQEKRAIHNDDFRRFLMTPTGEGFFKILVLSMNDGLPSVLAAQNARTTLEQTMKKDFILNTARSARICSSEDLQNLNSNSDLLRYACQANNNTARHERLKSEFLTYDTIPHEYVTDLRTTSRERRLRMADLILQMQFLDGDRTPSETLFFRSIVSKALGVDSIDDQEYFERLHAFIQDSGGLEPMSNTPTGFSIRSNSAPSPFSKSHSYTPANSPEAGPSQVTETKSSRVKSALADAPEKY